MSFLVKKYDFLLYVLEDILVIRVSTSGDSLLFIKRFSRFYSVLRQTQKKK